MSQTRAHTFHWGDDQIGWQRTHDKGGYYPIENCSIPRSQLSPSPNASTYTVTSPNGLKKAEHWDHYPWNFTGMPQYAWRSALDAADGSYDPCNTGQPQRKNTISPPPAQYKPVLQEPKPPETPHASSSQLAQPVASRSCSKSSSSPWTPFFDKRKKLQECHPNVWRASGSPQDSRPNRRDAIFPQQPPPSYFSACSRDSVPTRQNLDEGATAYGSQRQPYMSYGNQGTSGWSFDSLDTQVADDAAGALMSNIDNDVDADSMGPNMYVDEEAGWLDAQEFGGSSLSAGRGTPVDSSPSVDDAVWTRTCVSCADDLTAEHFSAFALTQSCQHPNSACKDCVKQWIDTRLGDGSWDEIKCLECNELMQYADVQRHADPKVFQRYDLLAARSWLNNEENFIWCRNQDCGSGQVHEGGKNMPLFRCIACKAISCIVHEVPWHEGETCAAFDRRMNGEDSVEDDELPNATSAYDFGFDIAQEHRNSANFVRMNDRQERRLYDQARERRTTTSDAQLARDLDAALALEYADDHAPQINSIYSNPWAQESSSGYMPSPSREWAHQFSAPRATTSPRPIQASTSRKDFMQKLMNKRSRDMSRRGSSRTSNNRLRTNVAHDSAFAHRLQRQSEDDEAYARNLQKQFERDDRERREKDARHQRSVRETNKRTARHQDAKDAAAAQALHKQFEREERERVQKQQRDQERQAYQRRKAEEKQGEQTVKTNAKQCPKCRWYIQKKDGCDHMTCWKCKHEFCWLCLADYQRIRDNGNSAHSVSCRDYRQ